jgi:hypothetical protein
MKDILPNSTWSTPVTPPSLSIYPKNVRALILCLRTPRQVQAWLRALKYNKQETIRTFGSVVRGGRAHCLEGALSAAAILEHHGFPPLILDLESTDLLDHTLFLYRHNNRYGAIGKSRDIGLDGRRPVFCTIKALVHSYTAPYIDAKACLTGYGVLDLRTLPRGQWRNSTRNVWYVENALRRIPHRKLHLSDSYVRTWRQKYTEFRRRHPDKQPSFYPDQHQWL